MSDMPINPWLAKVTLEFRRQNCDDEQLRRGYREYVRGGCEYFSWKDYVSRCALMDYVRRNPIFLMPRDQMPLPQHTRDLLNRLKVNCLADLMQISAEELDEFIVDKKEVRLINKFLKDNSLKLYSCKEKVNRLSIESIEKEHESYDATLAALIEKAKQTFKANDNKLIMSRSGFNEVVDAFEQADRFADLHDCGVETRKLLYYEYAGFLELKACLFEGNRELVERVDTRLIYYLYLTESGTSSIADGYIVFGNSYSMMADYTEAMKQYKIAMEMLVDDLEAKDRVLWLTRVFIRMGICYHDLEDYDNALDSYKTALDYAELLEKSRDEQKEIIYHNLSELYSDMGDEEQAEYYRSLTMEKDDLDDSDDLNDLFL